jgi:hypothetical protein
LSLPLLPPPLPPLLLLVLLLATPAAAAWSACRTTLVKLEGVRKLFAPSASASIACKPGQRLSNACQASKDPCL